MKRGDRVKYKQYRFIGTVKAVFNDPPTVVVRWDHPGLDSSKKIPVDKLTLA